MNAIFARIKWIHSAKQAIQSPPSQHTKILICSPSNSGCDELTRKIRNSKNSPSSYINSIGNRNLLIVRVGRTESLHRDSEEFSLEHLAEMKCDELVRKSLLTKTSSLKEQYNSFLNMEKVLEKKLKIARLSPEQYEKQIKELEDQKSELSKRKQKFEMQLKKNNGQEAPSVRRKLKQTAKEMILREADIIISTLNYCGNSVMDCLGVEKNKGKCLIDLIIVDEAAQSLEVESLIPLRFGCTKLIQVGDPEQLPATVLSKKAQVSAQVK